MRDQTPETLVTEEWNELYRTLANPNRRRVLEYLWRCGRPVPVEEIADRLTEWHAPDVGTDPQSHSRFVEELTVKLYHVDLPPLAGMGLIDWCEESGLVSLGDQVSDLPLFTPLHPGIVEGAGWQTDPNDCGSIPERRDV
jgi:DNA-binding transcriptional ArsR family regulator